MTDVSEQSRLILPRAPAPVEIETVRRMPSMSRAIQLCAQMAGFENDKGEARAVGLDTSTWSMVKDGKRAYPQDSYERMFDEFGNDAPLIWLMDRRGYAIVLKESESQRLLRVEREARIAAEQKLAYAESLLRGR